MKKRVGIVASVCLALGAGFAVAPSAGAAAAPQRPLASAPAPAPAVGATTVEGVIRLLAADTAADAVTAAEDQYRQVLVVGTTAYFLTGRQGEPNTRVRVTGTISGNDLAAVSIEPLGPAGADGSIPTFGTTDVLVMLAHWSAPDGVTPEEAAEQLFDDSNGWYRDASYTLLGQTGDVTPWMEIAGPENGACYADHLNTMSQAKAAAADLGYDIDAYDNYVLYSPNNAWMPGSDCDGFAGWAYVGAPNTWLNGYMDRRVTVHEQGHNYGLSHSHSYLCTKVITGTCSWSDYGDDYDAMGASNYSGHFSASQKDLLGWMDDRTLDLTAGGSATLAPLEVDAPTITAAVVQVSAVRSYWLEYRQPIDYDSGLPSSATNGVLVHVKDPTVDPSSFDASNLLDTRPDDGLGVSTATLRAGESWTTPEGFTLGVSALTDDGADVFVNAPVCPDLAYEPDDTAALAREVAVPTTEPHAFCSGEDEDWVKFAATAGEPYQLETRDLAHGTDTILELYAADGVTLIDSDDDGGKGVASSIDFTPEASGTYLLRARDFHGAGGFSSTYELVLAPADETAPELIAHKPADGATEVGRKKNLSATFSEAMKGVKKATFELTNTVTGDVVEATVSQRGKSNTWTLNPKRRLASGTLFTVTLTGGEDAIRDLAGNPFATTSWSFTSKA